jgi:hypothetical protein
MMEHSKMDAGSRWAGPGWSVGLAIFGGRIIREFRTPTAQIKRCFLVLFFKKEPLS